MPNSKTVGDRCEAEVLCRLVHAADTVLLPFGENQRYDMAFDVDGRIFRVQCKSGRLLRDGAVINFSTSSTYKRQGETVHVSLADSCDYFGVYCPATGGVYLIPSDAVGKREGTLSLDRTRSQRAPLATEFEVSAVVERLRS